MRTITSKILLYMMLVASLGVVIYIMSGCADRKDMPDDEVFGIIALDKELRR